MKAAKDKNSITITTTAAAVNIVIYAMRVWHSYSTWGTVTRQNDIHNELRAYLNPSSDAYT